MKQVTFSLLLIISINAFSQSNFLINTPTGFVDDKSTFTLSPDPAQIKLNLSYFNRINVGMGSYLGKNIFSGKGKANWDIKLDYNVKFQIIREKLIFPHLSIGFFKLPNNNIFDSSGKYFFQKNCAYISASKKMSVYNFHGALAYPVNNGERGEYIWLMGISRKILLIEFFLDGSYIKSEKNDYEKYRFNFGISVDLFKYFELKFTVSDFTRTSVKQFWLSAVIPIKKTEEKYESKNTYLRDDFTVWPTVGGKIISKFGYRNDPFSGKKAFHSGLDIAVEKNTPVYTILSGKVIETGEDSENGRYVIVEHNKNLSTYYLHLEKILVKKGQKTSEGEIIGSVGSTGRSEGAHLHFGTKLNGKFVDPVNILKNINDFK